MEEDPGIKKQSKGKKAINIILDVLMVLFASCAIFLLVISITSKKDKDGTATIFNTQLRFVQSNSMEKCELTDVSEYDIKSIPVKSCVFIETIPEDEVKRDTWLSKIKIGDVLTFKYVYTKQETITHRVTNIIDNTSSGYIITLEGDNKNAEDGTLKQVIDTSETDSPNYIIGKVKGQSYFLGLMVYVLHQPVGIICIIILPCSVIIFLNAWRIFLVLHNERKQKALNVSNAKEEEINKLKAEIELLKANTPKQEKEDS